MCTKIGTIVKQTGSKLEYFKLRCKSWQCDECGPMRRLALIREAKKGKPNRFITLTVNPNWFDSPEERAAQLSKAWRLTVAAFRHKWPKREAEYLCVFEATKLGEPHLHIMWRGGWVDQRWLSKQMKKRMGAPIVDVRFVFREKQVTEYITKYISKRSIKFGTSKRYWRSKNYLAKSPSQERKERNAGSIFYISKRHWIEHLENAINQNYRVTLPRPAHFTFELRPHELHPPWLFLEEGVVCGVAA